MSDTNAINGNGDATKEPKKLIPLSWELAEILREYPDAKFEAFHDDGFKMSIMMRWVGREEKKLFEKLGLELGVIFPRNNQYVGVYLSKREGDI